MLILVIDAIKNAICKKFIPQAMNI